MQKRFPHCMDRCFESLPFHSSLVTSSVLSALASQLTTNAKLQDKSWGKKVESRQWNTVSSKCGGKADTVYTHTFLLFGSEKHEGRRARHSKISPAPSTQNLSNYTIVFTLLRKRQTWFTQTWHAEITNPDVLHQSPSLQFQNTIWKRF